LKWDNSFNGIEYYSNVKSSSVEWIWYPYIPCGKITVLQGDPGEGKSTLILHIAAILTKGANLPDGNKIKKPMTVIYQCSEDSKADTIKPRLENAGADCRRVAFIKDDNGDLTLDDERIELAVKTTGAKLLVLDPIQAFIGKNGNMQSAVRMRETMTKLANIAEEYACAIVLVGHMTKSNSGKSIYRGLGSIDIAAAARSVLLVARDKDEPSKRYMLPIKSSLAPEGEPIAFVLDRDNGFSWIGKCEININELAVGQRVSAKKDIAINYLHTMLAESDMASVKIFEEMDRYGFSKRTVQEAKKEAGIQAYKKGNAWYWHMERSAADDGTGKTCCKPGRTEGEDSGEI